jgi:hypothetical protein
MSSSTIVFATVVVRVSVAVAVVTFPLRKLEMLRELLNTLIA